MSREVGRSKKHLLLSVSTQAVGTFTQPLQPRGEGGALHSCKSRSGLPRDEWGGALSVTKKSLYHHYFKRARPLHPSLLEQHVFWFSFLNSSYTNMLRVSTTSQADS